LIGGVRYAAYVRQETDRLVADYSPFVSVIAPTRGFEERFLENVRPLLAQNYTEYETLFVFDNPEDPSFQIVNDLDTRVVISGPANGTGQKVHNLIVAVSQIDARAEVIVFVDTDARPDENWLRRLVAPLADERIGASTGYRWFVPERGGLASRLRGVWNASIASALGADTAKNFCWGGSTAIRRSTFERLNVVDHWRGTVSDDFTITRVLKEANLPIHFTPNCLVASVGDCGWRELVEFTTRQIKITRTYARHLWVALLLGSSLFTIAFFGGIVLLVERLVFGGSFWPVLGFLIVIFALGAAKGFIRWRAISIPLAGYRRALRRDLAAHIFLWPFASLLYLYNAIVAGFSRRITWRGITYNLRSPDEAVIISRDS
jgi:cellulose synthase/poly-beta-1,6-N-acetylglucosamine synthase-like glycosyltransferase